MGRVKELEAQLADVAKQRDKDLNELQVGLSLNALLLWCLGSTPEARLLQSMMASLQDREAEMSSFVAAQQARHEQQEALKQVRESFAQRCRFLRRLQSASPCRELICFPGVQAQAEIVQLQHELECTSNRVSLADLPREGVSCFTCICRCSRMHCWRLHQPAGPHKS